MSESCPWCGSAATDAHFVDIGVGIQQASPYACLDCGAHEFHPFYDDTSGASADERARGWWAPEAP